MDNIFDNVKTIAIVGLSDKSGRPSYVVGKYLLSKGFTIVPVNPNIGTWEGIKAYPNLSSVPDNVFVDVVDIFRKSEEVMGIVEEAVLRGDAHTIWMQEGVKDEVAREFAESHGMSVVMDFCLMVAHKSSLNRDNSEIEVK